MSVHKAQVCGRPLARRRRRQRSKTSAQRDAVASTCRSRTPSRPARSRARRWPRDARRLCRGHLGTDPRRDARAEDRSALRRAVRRAHLADARRLPAARATPEMIGRWQADRLAAGAPVESTRKALTLSAESCNARSRPGGSRTRNGLCARPRRRRAEEVRPLAPATVEAIRARSRARDARSHLDACLRRARPQELRGCCGGTSSSRRWSSTRRRPVGIGEPRSVRLLAPLAQDLREWRLLSGRPGRRAPVIPALDGGGWTEIGFEQWRARAWTPALERVGLAYQRPYDLRHVRVAAVARGPLGDLRRPAARALGGADAEALRACDRGARGRAADLGRGGDREQARRGDDVRPECVEALTCVRVNAGSLVLAGHSGP